MTATFIPPTDKTPYLPPANKMSVSLVTTFGNYTYWLISDAAGNHPPPSHVILPSRDSQANVAVIAGFNVALNKLFAACISPPGSQDPGAVVAAQNWFNANIGPEYQKLLT